MDQPPPPHHQMWMGFQCFHSGKCWKNRKKIVMLHRFEYFFWTFVIIFTCFIIFMLCLVSVYILSKLFAGICFIFKSSEVFSLNFNEIAISLLKVKFYFLSPSHGTRNVVKGDLVSKVWDYPQVFWKPSNCLTTHNE